MKVSISFGISTSRTELLEKKFEARYKSFVGNMKQKAFKWVIKSLRPGETFLYWYKGTAFVLFGANNDITEYEFVATVDQDIDKFDDEIDQAVVNFIKVSGFRKFDESPLVRWLPMFFSRYGVVKTDTGRVVRAVSWNLKKITEVMTNIDSVFVKLEKPIEFRVMSNRKKLWQKIYDELF